MKYSILALVLACLFVSACANSSRTPPPVANPQVDNVWISLAEVNPADMSVPVHMTIRNLGTADARLIQVQYQAAKSVSLMNGKDPVDGVTIPAGQTVDFNPQGYHPLIVGLPQGMAPTNTFNIGLVYGSSATSVITVIVRQ